jgi:hypothetical protein
MNYSYSKKRFQLYTALIALMLNCGCSWQPSLLESALGGSAIGAGTGAVIGNVISRGDVAASAGLGAAIGLPVGLALGYYYRSYIEEQKRKEVAYIIREQQEEILSNNIRLSQFKDDLDRDHPRDIDESRRDYYYDGQTFANPLR